MLLIYSLMDRQLIFAADSVYQNLGNNQKKQYMYRMWENYGYIDYVTYEEYIASLVASGELDSSELEKIQDLGKKAEDDSETVAEYVKKFSEYYESKGYTIVRLDAITIKKGRKYADGGQEALFAYRDKPLLSRLAGYFTGIVDIDSIHYVDDSIDIGKRGISFTLHDPAYGGEKFSPALIGNGTKYKFPGKAIFTPGKKAWMVKCDIACPSAFQNEMNEADAKELIANGVQYVAEISNMGCQPGAIAAIQKAKIPFAPGKAVNAGGVATSGLEICQNAGHINWTAEEVDAKLHKIMDDIYDMCVEYGKQKDGSINYVNGANIAGFMRVAKAMLAQGII